MQSEKQGDDEFSQLSLSVVCCLSLSLEVHGYTTLRFGLP